jgi:RNA polymerase sigma-70 factor (ECF subfamily)
MQDTPASLLERLCRHPDEPHWERFVLLFTPLLSRWGHRLGVPAADAEDLLQEVFTILFRTLPEFHYDPDRSFRAWLWTVFYRQTLAWRKRQARHLPLSAEQLEALACPDRVPEAAESEYRRVLLARVLQIVKTDFPVQTWQLFWQVAVEGRRGADVARQLGVTPNTVYLARSRVLARLREELAELDS